MITKNTYSIKYIFLDGFLLGVITTTFLIYIFKK
jgi:hypothetical protein